jgi:hypothetical protein
VLTYLEKKEEISCEKAFANLAIVKPITLECFDGVYLKEFSSNAFRFGLGQCFKAGITSLLLQTELPSSKRMICLTDFHMNFSDNKITRKLVVLEKKKNQKYRASFFECGEDYWVRPWEEVLMRVLV